MSNNFLITQGTGTTVATEQGTGTEHYQKIKLIDSTPGSTTGTGIAANPIKVDPTGTTTQPVSGTFWPVTQPVSGSVSVTNFPSSQPVTGTFFQATQPVSGTFFQATQPVSIASMPSTPVTGTFFQATQPVSGTVTANAGTGSFNVAQATAANLNATVTGTVTANQGGTWTVQPGNTPNTTAWKVDGSAVTQPISASSLPLPSGASTSALQTTGNTSLASIVTNTTAITVTQASITSGQTGQLIQGAVTTTPPTYTTAQTNPLSLTTSGALRVDASSTTQPVSGTVTANAGTGSFTVAQTTAANLNATVTVANPVIVRAASLCISTTAATGVAVTATLPAVAAQFHYITSIEIVKYFTAANAASATPLVITTTNLSGSLAFTLGQPLGTIGTTDRILYTPNSPLQSSVVNTATTIVCPATTGIIWRVNVFYFAAP